MAARKKRAVVPLPPEENIDPSDVTERLFPEGTPQNEDGSVAGSAQVEIKQIRKVGALTSDAARHNKIMAQTLDRKAKGESVQWNNTDLLTAFDTIKIAFPNSMIVVTNLSTGASYKPTPVSAFRSIDQLYLYIESIHRGQPQTQYEAVFKEGGSWQIRAKCKVTMPDSMTQEPQAQQHSQQYPWQIPQMPYGYGAPQSIPYPQPQPQQLAPTPASNPAPQPQAQMPQPIVIPPGTDPATAAALRSIQEQNHQLQVQIAAILGANQEYKNMLAQHQFAQPQPQAQGVGAPPAPPPPVTPVEPRSQPQQQRVLPGMMALGYGPDGQIIFGYPGQTPGAPVGQPQASAAPPPPPPPPPTATATGSGFVGAIPPRSTDPIESATSWVAQTMTAVQGLNKLRASLDKAIPSGVQHASEPEDDDDVPAPEPAIRSPFGMTKVGDGPDPMVLLTDEKGKIDIGATLTGNITKIPGLLHGLADGLQRINGSIEQIERNRPIVAQGVSAPNHSVVGQIPVRMP